MEKFNHYYFDVEKVVKTTKHLGCNNFKDSFKEFKNLCLSLRSQGFKLIHDEKTFKIFSNGSVLYKVSFVSISLDSDLPF